MNRYRMYCRSVPEHGPNGPGVTTVSSSWLTSFYGSTGLKPHQESLKAKKMTVETHRHFSYIWVIYSVLCIFYGLIPHRCHFDRRHSKILHFLLVFTHILLRTRPVVAVSAKTINIFPTSGLFIQVYVYSMG